jgi:hypothetical protein
MSNLACRRLSEAIFDTDLIATRVILAMAETLWAVMLWWPGETFSRPTYFVMSQIFPENVWAMIFTITACLQIHIVLAARYRGVLARNFALWNAGLWVVVIGSMLMSVYPPPAAIAGEIALMFGAVWIWARPFILAHWYREAYGRAGI